MERVLYLADLPVEEQGEKSVSLKNKFFRF